MSHLKKFMKYLIKTDFRGYMVFGLDQESSKQLQQMQSNSEAQVINESKIKDLGILTFLAMLRIDAFAACPEGTNKEKTNLINGLYHTNDKNFLKLKKMICGLQPTGVSSIIFLALLVVLSQVEIHEKMHPNALQIFSKDFQTSLIEQHFMVEIRNMF